MNIENFTTSMVIVILIAILTLLLIPKENYNQTSYSEQLQSTPLLSDEISDVDYKLLKRYLAMNPDICDELIKESFTDEIITYEETHAILQCIDSKIDRTDKQKLIEQYKGE